MDFDVDVASTVLFPTSSQESEIPSEPYDEIDRLGMMDVIEDNDVSFLSDEDGEEDLLNEQVRIKVSQKQKDAQNNLKTKHEGLVTEVGGVTWKVKFHLEEKSRPDDDHQQDKIISQEAKSYDNAYSPIFFRKLVTEEHLVRMVANFNRHQKMIFQRCREFNTTAGGSSYQIDQLFESTQQSLT